MSTMVCTRRSLLSAVAVVVGALSTGKPMFQGTPVADCDSVMLSRALNRARFEIGVQR